MTEITGDILEIESGIICHQVNCQRVAGAGLARQIRGKWPEWYPAFKEAAPKLGKLSINYVDARLAIANFYAQYYYGQRHGRQTDYPAFEHCLSDLADWIKSVECVLLVYFPYRIGCGLAGGDWSVIKPLLEKYFPDGVIVKRPND